MTIEQLIQFAQMRLANLTSQKTSAETLGDLAQIDRLSIEIFDTEQTIEKLKSLL